MASDVPYLLSVKNLGSILDRIKEAGTPPKFTNEFLRNNLGFTSSSDRGVIKILKQLGFLSADSIPTPRYNEFRNDAQSRQALAIGMREGWPQVFLSDQKAPEKTTGQLKELFKNVTGAGEAVAEKMASTFKALADRADWSSTVVPPVQPSVLPPALPGNETRLPRDVANVALHHDVHIHLPATSDVSVYSAIFRAMKAELLD